MGPLWGYIEKQKQMQKQKKKKTKKQKKSLSEQSATEKGLSRGKPAAQFCTNGFQQIFHRVFNIWRFR